MSVFGETRSALDFGDGTLPFTGHWFVAVFDGSGATLGAFAWGGVITHIAMTAQGAVLFVGLGGDAGRVSFTLRITGAVNPTIDGLAASPDGSAWIYLGNFVDDDDLPEPVIEMAITRSRCRELSVQDRAVRRRRAVR